MKMKAPYDVRRYDELRRRYYDYNAVYNTPEGKRVIDDIILYASIDRTAFNHKSELQTFFNLGKQSMGYHINNVMHYEPEQPTTTNKEDEDGSGIDNI